MEAFGSCAAQPFARSEAAVLVVRCSVRLRFTQGAADGAAAGVAGTAGCLAGAAGSVAGAVNGQCARRAKVARRLRKAASVCFVRYPE